MDRRIPAVFALVVALLLLASPLYVLPHAGQPTYSHSIDRIDASEIPGDADVQEYSTLSPEAQRAIDEALASDDGHALISGENNRPPEFVYSDYTNVGHGIYFISDDGAHYRLSTFAAGGLFPIDLWLQWGLLTFGAGLAIVAGGSLREERQWVPAIFGIAGTALLAAVVGGLQPYGRFGLFAATWVGVASVLVTIGYSLRPRLAAGVGTLLAAAPFVGLLARGWSSIFPLLVAILLGAFVGAGMALRQIHPIRRLRA